MATGIDTTVSTITVAQLEAGDYDFICRYILDAPGGQKKQITKAEVSRFTLGGKRICSNFEWGEQPPDTVAEGKAHARAALDWASDFKVPEWSPIYFSQDANNPAGKYVNYFTGVCDILGPERSAMYGNGACYRYLLGKKLISYAWHSKSSSYAGNHDTTGANVVQQVKTATVGGHTVDVNIAQTALYGGWLLGEENPMALTKADAQLVVDMLIADRNFQFLIWRMDGIAHMRDVFGGPVGLSGTTVPLVDAIKALPTTAVPAAPADAEAVADAVVDELHARLES